MHEKLKVLIVVPSVGKAGGGVSESVVNLTQALASSKELKIEIVSCFDKGDEGTHIGVDKSQFFLYRYIGPSNFKISFGLLWHVLTTDAQLVHVHGVWMFHVFAVYLLSVIRRIKYVVTPHGMLEPWIVRRSPVLKRIISALFQRRFLERASMLHALNSQEKSDLLDWNQRVLIIPNFVRPPDSELISAEWKSIVGSRKIFLFLGRIHEKKGCEELLKAWDKASEKSHEFAENNTLVFLGWNDGLSTFPRPQMQSINRFKNCYYFGPQYGIDKWRALITSTFFILPSKSEGLPMAVLEAWALGKPALITKQCNLDIGVEVGAAMEISSDAEQLCEDLLRATKLSDSQIRDMGIKGQQLIKSNYSQDYVVKQFTDCYLEMVNAV